MLCWIPVTAHAAGHREAPTSPHAFYLCGKQLYTAKSYAKYFRKLCKSSGQNVIVKVTHQSGTFPEKYKQPYNCQRQKTLPASAYAAMGLRHFAGSTLLSDFQTIAYEKNHPQAGSLIFRPAVQRWSFIRHGPQGNGIMIITGTIPCQTALITRVFLTVRLRRSPKSTMLSSLRLAHSISALQPFFVWDQTSDG